MKVVRFRGEARKKTRNPPRETGDFHCGAPYVFCDSCVRRAWHTVGYVVGRQHGNRGVPMKRNKSLIAGIICAVLCAFCVFAYTGSIKANAEAERVETLERFGGEQVEVYVATRNISAGETVDMRSAEARTWVADLLPEGSVHDLATIMGKKATAAIYEGEVITEFRFDTAGSNLTVPEGFVAVSVPAQEVNAVGGAVVAGSRINIYAAGASATELIGENVLVLDTSSLAADSLTGSSTDWLTIAVLPESVQEIIAAIQNTKLYFSLPSLSVSRLSSSTVVTPEPLDPILDTASQQEEAGVDSEIFDEDLDPAAQEAPVEEVLEGESSQEMSEMETTTGEELASDDEMVTSEEEQVSEEGMYDAPSEAETW